MSIAAMSPPGDLDEVKLEIDNHESKPALTPPTSESTGKKDDDDSGSELSDLEPEESVEEPEPPQPQIKEEDEEEIVPDHYYEGGKVPVFKPVSYVQKSSSIFSVDMTCMGGKPLIVSQTMKQFRSFKEFILKIDKYGMKSGIVKVVPPKEW